MLAAHSLGLDDGAHFPAGILGIEVVEQVADRGKITVAMFGIHAVVHGDESHIHAGEYDLCVVSNLQIVPAEAAHVLHNDRADLPRFHQGEQFLHRQTVEVGASIAVVHEESRAGEAVIVSILLKQCSLRRDLSRVFSSRKYNFKIII